MRRLLLWSVLGGTLVVLLLALVVNQRVDGIALPPPDGRLPIRLPDGETLPLSELVAKLGRETRAPVERLRVTGPPSTADVGDQSAALDRLTETLYPGIGWGPVFKLAEHHRQAGRSDQALALFQSVPEGDPDYGRAQRRIAWSILTYERNQPEAAVPHAHRALLADPLDGNSWQDLVVIYGRTLGVSFD
ncbi:MAG: tetratricopeptide repeat protein [Planctomycetota bacterium]|jgi:hypothetical protein